MHKFAYRILTAGIALLIGTADGHAASVHDALTNFGIIGKWAMDCSAPASEKNYIGVFSASGSGDGKLQYDYGPQYEPRTYIIHSAAIKDDQIMFLTTDSSDHTNDTMVMHKSGNRIQTLSNIQSDNGQAIVKNGIKVMNGEPADWLTYCK
ncbi:MAG TPA: hypothetical protein VHW02_03830 [Rhizomicrobium sp.]|nr:hypothetical protein [Rhizomicrobium sp.]